MLKEKYISEAQMKEEPKKKLVLKIKEGSITPEHFNKREVENYLQEVIDSIEGTGMLPEDKAKLDALPTASELQSTLNGKQNSLTFDSAPTENSANPVYSGGIKSYVDNHIPKTDATPTQGSNNPVSSNGVYQAIQAIDVSSQVSGKADKSEMSVVAGTGADADKTTITLKSGTSATVLTQHQDVSEFIKEGEVFGTGDDSTASFNPYSDTVWNKTQTLSENQKQQIRENIGVGDADNEDIQNVSGELKFADKAYNTSSHSGLGRKYLRKNIVSNKNVLTQAMVNTANTIYHIQYDYDLNGQTVTMPAGCVLEFEGGTISNGSVVGNNTSIIAPPVEILDTSLSGTWNCSSYCEWVGGDLKKAVEVFGGVSLLENKTYNVSETITFPFGASISGFSSSIVKSAASNIGIMFNLGFHNTLNGFTVIANHDCTVVNIQTDNLSKTYGQRNDRGPAAIGNCNIIIDGVRFRSNSIDFTHNCIEIISDGYSTSQTTLLGFWGVQIVNCLIAGYWKNAIHLDCGSNVNNTSIDSWLTSCFFRNILASNLKDGFLLAERNDKGYVGTLKVSSIIFDSCELQYSSSVQYFAKCDHSEILFNYCIPMDFTNVISYIVNQDNSYLRINISNFNGEYEHYVSRIGESKDSSGFVINNGNIIGTMPSYFLNDLETTDIAKVSNFLRLPIGSFSSELNAANYKQLKLDKLVNYGPSSGRTKYVLKKELGYGYSRYTITIYSSFGVGIYYLLILDSSISTSNIPDWNVIPGLLKLSNLSQLTTSNNGLGSIYYINGKYASRPENWLTKDALGHQFTDNQFVDNPAGFPTFLQPGFVYNCGKMLLDKASKEIAVYDNTSQKWYEGGVVAGTPKSGATTNRPSGEKIYVGFMYFDTTLSKPVYASAIANADPCTVTWVDGTGTAV